MPNRQKDCKKKKKLFFSKLPLFYSYLNLESTKTLMVLDIFVLVFYSYLNLESTKTRNLSTTPSSSVLQLLKSWEYKN